MIYRTEKRSEFNQDKEKLEYYWIVVRHYHTYEKKWFKHKIKFHKEECGDILPLGLHPYMRIITIPYKFSAKEKAEQYIKDIQSL